MPPAGTSLLIVNEADQILHLLRDDNPHIPYPNMWGIPGGHVEPDETPEQCIVPEMNIPGQETADPSASVTSALSCSKPNRHPPALF